MNSKLKKALLKYILPFLAILVLSFYDYKISLLILVLYIIYLFYTGRANFFTYFGSVNYSNGKIHRAITWLKRAYATGKANPKSAASYGYLLLKSGEVGESEQIFNKLLKTTLSKENESFVKTNLALVIWKKGDLDLAVSMFEEVITDYKNSTIYSSLGYLLILKGDLDKALQFNLEAFEFNNANTVILDNLGQTYYMMGTFDKALEIFEMLISKKPKFPEAYYNYGLVLEKLGQPEQALEMMEIALNSNFSFLSTVSRDEIESKIEELRKIDKEII